MGRISTANSLFLFLTILVGSSFFVPAARATPAHIVILRHGEKRSDEDRNLSPQGYQRADALALYFSQPAFIARYGLPTIFFAANPKKDKSMRSLETLSPAAKALGIPLNAAFDRDEGTELMQSILDDPKLDGKTVVICWNHAGMDDLLVPLGQGSWPKKWPGKVFDRFWILEKAETGQWNFQNVPQNLLPGDSLN